VRFDAYIDIDGSDSARVRVYVQGSNNHVQEYGIPETGCSGSCMKKLQKDIGFKMTAVKGKKFRLRFLYAGRVQQNREWGNQGAGVFFDNVRLLK